MSQLCRAPGRLRTNKHVVIVVKKNETEIGHGRYFIRFFHHCFVKPTPLLSFSYELLTNKARRLDYN